MKSQNFAQHPNKHDTRGSTSYDEQHGSVVLGAINCAENEVKQVWVNCGSNWVHCLVKGRRKSSADGIETNFSDERLLMYAKKHDKKTVWRF